MRYFDLIGQDADVVPLANAIARNPQLWNQNTFRKTFEGSPHSEMDDIWLRFNPMPDAESIEEIARHLDQHESINYPAMFHLPQARKLIFGLMAFVEGERLGRVMITRLAPGKAIAPHCDSEAHAEYYDRYHIILKCPEGCIFRAMDEHVQMRAGQIWWFDNAVDHEVVNLGDEDRITLIVDIRTTRW